MIFNSILVIILSYDFPWYLSCNFKFWFSILSYGFELWFLISISYDFVGLQELLILYRAFQCYPSNEFELWFLIDTSCEFIDLHKWLTLFPTLER